MTLRKVLLKKNVTRVQVITAMQVRIQVFWDKKLCEKFLTLPSP
jgi:hypothetical protein